MLMHNIKKIVSVKNHSSLTQTLVNTRRMLLHINMKNLETMTQKHQMSSTQQLKLNTEML